MNRKSLTILIGILAAVLIILSICAILLGKQPPTTPESTSPSTEVSQPETESSDPPATEPPVSEPPVTEPPVTEPPVTQSPVDPNGGEMIGNLYTREQLMAMSNDSRGYGPGVGTNHSRAPYAVNEQNAFGKYGGNFIGPDNNCIYLTFDCGYEYTATNPDGTTYRVTEKILNTLKEKDVKAVFFVTMDYVKKQPDLVQRMIDEGHVVGNHSKTHPVMTQCSIDKIVDEVMSLHNYVLEHFDYTMTLFRPPTGEFSIRSLATVQSLGYKNVHWSFAYYDYDTAKQPDPASALQTVKDRSHSGAIYLLHAVSTTNASILSDAIDYFITEGYTLALFQ